MPKNYLVSSELGWEEKVCVIPYWIMLSILDVWE